MKEKNKNAYVGLAAVIGGMLIVIIVIFAIFATSQMQLLVPIAWALVVLGMVLGVLHYKSHKKN